MRNGTGSTGTRIRCPLGSVTMRDADSKAESADADAILQRYARRDLGRTVRRLGFTGTGCLRNSATSRVRNVWQ